MTTRKPSRPVVLAVTFFLSTAALLALVLLPIGWQLNRLIVWLYYAGRGLGVPRFVTLEWYDIGLNVFLFAVPTLVAALLWRHVRWWMWPFLSLVTSIVIEVVQYYYLPREFSLIDIAANTAGGLLGAGVAEMIQRSRTDKSAQGMEE